MPIAIFVVAKFVRAYLWPIWTLSTLSNVPPISVQNIFDTFGIPKLLYFCLLHFFQGQLLCVMDVRKNWNRWWASFPLSYDDGNSTHITYRLFCTSSTYLIGAQFGIIYRTALQICAGKLQWNYSQKNVILKNCSFLLLVILHCIFYKLKIVILALFSCSLFCIELNAHITSFHCIFKNATKNCKNWTKKLQIHT